MILCVDSIEAIKLKIISLRIELDALEDRLYELEKLEYDHRSTDYYDTLNFKENG